MCINRFMLLNKTMMMMTRAQCGNLGLCVSISQQIHLNFCPSHVRRVVDMAVRCGVCKLHTLVSKLDRIGLSNFYACILNFICLLLLLFFLVDVAAYRPVLYSRKLCMHVCVCVFCVYSCKYHQFPWAIIY